MILHELIATTNGALAALFLDYEGETVELVCEHDLEDPTPRILGAYQAFSLPQPRTMCNDIGAGEPRRFKVEFEETAVLLSDIKDGYYVVLLVGRSANEGFAWRQLERCRDRLIEEM